MGKRSENGDPRTGKLFYAAILTSRGCDLGSIGLDGKRVYSIGYRDVGALVSDYPRVASIKMLRKNLSPFYEVLRKASRQFTTVPARFGQIARDEGEVSLALRRNYHRIRQEVARLDGKVEMGLRVWWQVDDVFEFLLGQDSELRDRRNQKLAELGSLDRLAEIDFGRYVFDRMNRARRRTTDSIMAALPEGEARLDELPDDRMVTNAALLIREDDQPDLESAVDALALSLGDAYKLEVDGPWPPFSFADRLELPLSHS